jgi:hypothetical protein
MKKFKEILLATVLLLGAPAFANPIVTTLDQVIVTSTGFFINIEGNLQSVESLTIANNNYVIAIPSPMVAICPNCKSDKYVEGRFCPRCGFPDDGKVKNAVAH